MSLDTGPTDSGELVPQPAAIPAPSPSPLSQHYWDACVRGELLFQRCGNCGKPNFDPALLCRHCGSRAADRTSGSADPSRRVDRLDHDCHLQRRTPADRAQRASIKSRVGVRARGLVTPRR